MPGIAAYYAALFLAAADAVTARPAKLQGRLGGSSMKADIHPKYGALTASCSCGHVIQTRSTLARELSLDVCSKCHPFYSGKQKVLDTGGRIDRFKKRFGAAASRR
jgi:large subunit ribosomal protein L31